MHAEKKRKNLIRRAFFRGNMNSLTIQVKQNNKRLPPLCIKFHFEAEHTLVLLPLESLTN
jgi:hypothetical protein